MQINTKSPYARLLAATLLVASLGVLGSCDTFNPFNPIAAVDVLAVDFTGSTGGASTTAGTGQGAAQISTAGLIQTIQTDANGIPSSLGPTYTILDPTVTLRNRPSAPEVRFKTATVIFDIPGLQIPQKTFLNQFLLPQGPAATAGATGTSGGTPITVKVVSLFFDDLLHAVFPNNAAPIVRSGSAHIFLSGKDSNDHDIVIDFTTPLTFVQAQNQTGSSVAPGATASTSTAPTASASAVVAPTAPPSAVVSASASP